MKVMSAKGKIARTRRKSTFRIEAISTPAALSCLWPHEVMTKKQSVLANTLLSD